MPSIQLKFLAVLLIVQTAVFGQEEKRLALVIGNSDYTVAQLDNPVNDAVLMAKTLDSLNFDVILDTNLATRRDFIESIKKFGVRVHEYDVTFIYYAGHGIQLNGENYMLPTNETFESEFDVEEYGVKVQSILRFLNSDISKMSVFVLDACRNNPFESSWNKRRSLDKGSGLARVEVPSGSLIAFSTAPGSTAPDGSGENSLYCSILSEQLLVPESSIEQVFRNVRSEIHSLTNGEQRPVENTQLLGEEYFLIPRSFENELRLFNEYLLSNKLMNCLELTSGVLSSDSTVTEAWIKRGHAYALLGKNQEARKSYHMALEIDSSALEAYTTLIKYKNGSNEWVGLLNLSDLDSIEKVQYAKNLLPYVGMNPFVFRNLSVNLYLLVNQLYPDRSLYRKLLNKDNISLSDMNYWTRRMCISFEQIDYNREHELIRTERLMNFYFSQFVSLWADDLDSSKYYANMYGDSIRQSYNEVKILPNYIPELSYWLEAYLMNTGQFEEVVEIRIANLNAAKSPKDSCFSVIQLISAASLSTSNFPYDQIENFHRIFNRNFNREKLGTGVYNWIIEMNYFDLIVYNSVIEPNFLSSKEYFTNYLDEIIFISTGSKVDNIFNDVSKKEVIKSISNSFDLTTVASTYYCFYISQFLDEKFTHYNFDHFHNIANMLQLNGLIVYSDTAIIDDQEVELFYDSPEMFGENFSSAFSDLSYITIINQEPEVKNFIANLDEIEKLKFRALLGDAIINTVVDMELDRQLKTHYRLN